MLDVRLKHAMHSVIFTYVKGGFCFEDMDVCIYGYCIRGNNATNARCIKRTQAKPVRNVNFLSKTYVV